ncbi:uncharacterized protein LOC18432397 [Amborella trichopoda]|uniref:Legume lectin domain-containing protein n=1 Tax=Amborella trichopoda TaxID=13333 RepID=W1P323_AMBTC|nr:uncharacterized protein LOC18432397 [Amborella trichopoda]XP_020521845.1 uncharacterized protein LOC18432397 [Amborella trichopoda]ERN04242.1 hypothetical protein AMTR_s00077p00148460 [Amborella trichopoda]|eukprot:XP_020521844.1 uncharacterized protein LOC18432397 [Amborella trichopoda]
MKSVWGLSKLTALSFLILALSISSEVQARNYVYEGQQSVMSSRHLDSLLQDNAYKALNPPLTGVVYEAPVPSNMTGIALGVVRLRSGSLRRRGYKYRDFSIPPGVVEKPYVKRIALVFQNLGHWSSSYYDVVGYSFVTPVLGLLAYNASDLLATNLPELDLRASIKPISIEFSMVRVPEGAKPKCAQFQLNGTITLNDLIAPNVCYTSTLGHFAVIYESKAPSPSPSPSPCPCPEPSPNKDNSRVWQIVLGSVVAGVGVLGLLGLMAYGWLQNRKKLNVVAMEKQADEGENLRIKVMGSTKAPVAAETRTRPALENEHFLWNC